MKQHRAGVDAGGSFRFFHFLNPVDDSSRLVVAASVLLRLVVAVVCAASAFTEIEVWGKAFMFALAILPTVQAIQITRGRRW